LSQTKTLLVKVPIEDVKEEGDVEVSVHQQDDDSDAYVKEYEFNGCIRTVGETNLIPSLDQAQLGVGTCILSQPEQLNG